MKGRAKKPVSEEAMRLRMADLCAHSEQCASDLKTKMFKAGLSSTAISDIIDFLKKERFLDEARYAASYARDKVRFSGWGVMKIRRGLIAKHISSADIETGIAAIDRKEYIEAFKRVALAKAGALNMADREDVQKLFRYLIGRGFETSLISKIVGYLRKD